MPQAIQCTGCSKRFAAPDTLAGKNVRCPQCKTVLSIPALNSSPSPSATKPSPPIATKSSPPSPAAVTAPKKPSAPAYQANIDWDDEELKLAPAPKPAAPAASAPLGLVAGASAPLAAAPPATAARPATKSVSVRPTLAESSTARGRPRFLYCAFALALIPLAFSLLGGPSDIEARFERSFAAVPDFDTQVASITSLDGLLALLPDGRIEGAHLARGTAAHWFYAIVAAVLFLGLIRLLFEPGQATLVQILVVGLITATVGIFLLLAFQWLAELSQSVVPRGRGLLSLLFWVIKLIGFSYRAAADPENGFVLSMIGYTFGVGLCEEIVKLLPVYFAAHNNPKLGWRGACTLGLASGVGFGVAEGVHYAAEYYNGLQTFDMYLVRFVSCVALHATWTASCALVLVNNQEGFEADEWTDWLVHMIYVIAVPMALHGLYDTLLKRDMAGLALVAALASFGWLIFLVERARSIGDDEEELPTPRKRAVSMARA